MPVGNQYRMKDVLLNVYSMRANNEQYVTTEQKEKKRRDTQIWMKRHADCQVKMSIVHSESIVNPFIVSKQSIDSSTKQVLSTIVC